jgi:hypothetical protein
LRSQAKVRLQAKSPKTDSIASPSTSEQQPQTTTSVSPPGSFADVVKHEPAHQHGDHLVTSTDLEANKAEASSSKPHITRDEEREARKAPVEKKKFTSAVELLQYTYAKHGFKGWYQGMSAQILKAVLSQGASPVFPYVSEGKGEELIMCTIRDLVHAQGSVREVRSGSDDPGQKSFGSAVNVSRSIDAP